MRVSVWVFCALLSSLAIADETLQQAVILYEQGELEAAESQFKGMQSADPGRADTYYYLGLIEQSRGEFLSAAELFEQAVERDSQQSTYYQALGEAYGSAIEDEMDAYLVLGIFLTNKARYAEAMQVYDKGLVRNSSPDNCMVSLKPRSASIAFC